MSQMINNNNNYINIYLGPNNNIYIFLNGGTSGKQKFDKVVFTRLEDDTNSSLEKTTGNTTRPIERNTKMRATKSLGGRHSKMVYTHCKDIGISMIIIDLCHQLVMLVHIQGTRKAGVEINARPLARGEWKPRGMSRIFAEVVRRAS